MFWEPFTEEETRLLFSFINNEDTSVLDTDIPARFAGMFNAFQKKLLQVALSQKKDNVRLSRKVDSIKKAETTAIEAGEFTDLGFDSIDISKALFYSVGLYAKRAIRQEYFMLILYQVYAAWLSSHKERIFIEHPCAYRQPWFWRVAKNWSAITKEAGKDNLDAVFQKNSGVGVLVKRAAEKYANMEDRDLRDYILKSQPYRNADKENNNGKWGKVISDPEIYFWKKEQA